MFGKKITSKDQLIKALADEFDSCFDQSYPVVDLTDQIVATVMDSAYSDPDVNDWLHGHEVVSIEPLDSHESYSIMERFALSRPGGQSQRLCDVLSKKHPFRRFKDAVNNLGIAEEWYAWRADALFRYAEESLGILRHRLHGWSDHLHEQEECSYVPLRWDGMMGRW